MNPGDHELFGTQTPLVYCPQCDSRLEYAVDVEAADKDVVLDRSCPGCESPRLRRDVLAEAYAVWYRRETRILAELRPLVVFLVESSSSDNALIAERLEHVS